MFRLGARRCARLQASVLATPAMLLRPRAAIPIVHFGAASTSTPIASPFKSALWSARAYSSEAAAVEEPVRASTEVSNFADLADLGVHPSLITAVTKHMGYQTMTPVQSKTISPAMKGTDIVAQAKTGTGKTLAFLLPIFQRMLAEDSTLASRSASRRARSDDIRGIVLSPTRELAEQIAVEARNLAKNTGIVVQVAVGGTNKRDMLRKTQREGCHLLVATPGRLYDLLSDERSGIAAPNLAALVMDEADRILDVGFEKQIHEIIEILPDTREKVRQTMLVSATIPEDVIDLARKMVRADDFEFVQTIGENETLTHDRVPQHIVPLSSWGTMFPTLFELIDRESARLEEDPNSPPFKAIVYLNTTAATEFATRLGFLRKRSGQWKKFWLNGIQSKLSQAGRQRAADGFRTAKSGILFSSDVTARGMDFPNVTHVIQIDTPSERESYIHRIGRTARQNKDGQAWLLLPPASTDKTRKLLRGLPLKANNSLSEVADAAIDGSSDLAPVFGEVQGLVQSIPADDLYSFYTSLIASAGDKSATAEELSVAWTAGFGFDNPPAISSSWASRMGLRSWSALNISQRGGRSSDGDRERSDRPGRFDRGRGGSSRDGDAFDQMRGNIRSDRPSSNGRFGRRGGDRQRNFGGDSQNSRW